MQDGEKRSIAKFPFIGNSIPQPIFRFKDEGTDYHAIWLHCVKNNPKAAKAPKPASELRVVSYGHYSLAMPFYLK